MEARQKEPLKANQFHCGSPQGYFLFLCAIGHDKRLAGELRRLLAVWNSVRQV